MPSGIIGPGARSTHRAVVGRPLAGALLPRRQARGLRQVPEPGSGFTLVFGQHNCVCLDYAGRQQKSTG